MLRKKKLIQNINKYDNSKSIILKLHWCVVYNRAHLPGTVFHNKTDCKWIIEKKKKTVSQLDFTCESWII